MSLYQQLNNTIKRLTKLAEEKGVKFLYLYEGGVPSNINKGLSRYCLDKCIVVRESDDNTEISSNNAKFGAMLDREIYKAIKYAEEN